MRILVLLCATTLPLLAACTVSDVPKKTGVDTQAEQKVKPKTHTNQVKQIEPAKVTKRNVSQKARPKRKASGKDIKWVDKINWESWAEGRRKAAEEGKALCLVIYTNWCPRCRELAPVFASAEVEAAAKSMIMVRQNQDERPEWLNQYVAQGRYVPRILFFGKDGNLMTDVTSGIKRYPYFYTPRSQRSLLASMKKASM